MGDVAGSSLDGIRPSESMDRAPAVTVVVVTPEGSTATVEKTNKNICKAISTLVLSCGDDTDALNTFFRTKYIAILILLSSVVLPISDTGSDIALTVEWLQSSNGEDRWFGGMSLAIIVVSAFVPACAMFMVESIAADFHQETKSVYNEQSGMFHPVLGFFLSMTELRLPVTTLLQAKDILKNGVTDKYTRGPSAVTDWEADDSKDGIGKHLKIFSPGASIIMALRLFELLGETTLELLLQTYKAAYEYFVFHIVPELLLRVSIIISFLTLSFGIVETLLNDERFVTRLLATAYCLASLIARFAVITAFFVEFGYTALSLIIPAYFLRIIMAAVREREGIFKDNEGLNWAILLIQMALVFDHALTFILPFGKRHHPEIDASSNWHLALQGAQNYPIVTEKLTSPFALGNLALTLLENSAGWMCVGFADSGSKTTANVTMGYFYTCGLLMMCLMPVTLALTYASSKKFPATIRIRHKTRDQLMEAVKLNGFALEHASEELKNDREIVLEAIKQNVQALEYAPKELQNDREFLLKAVKKNGDALQHASQELHNDREIVLKAVKQNGDALRFASKELQNDREIVLKAVKQNGDALRFASKELHTDREIVLKAVKQNGNALQFASKELQNDREFVLKAVKQNGDALRCASVELQNDRKFVLEAVKKNWNALQYVPKERKNDHEIVLEAYKQDERALQYASEELQKELNFNQRQVTEQYTSEDLQKDRESVLEAVKQNGDALRFAPKELQNDREFVLEAVKKNWSVLAYASEELKNDHEIVLEAAKQDVRALQYASEELKKELNFNQRQATE